MADGWTFDDFVGGASPQTNDAPLRPIFGPGGYEKVLDQYGNLKTPGYGTASSATEKGGWGFDEFTKPQAVQASATDSGGPSWSDTLETAKENMPSPVDYLKSQLTNPITDVSNAYHLARGLGGKVGLVEPTPEETAAADATLHHYGNYFSTKGLKENVSQDPIGTLTDVLSLALPNKGLRPGGIGERALATADDVGASNLRNRAATQLESAKDSGVHFTQPFTSELSNRFRQIAQENGYREGKHGLVKDVLNQVDLMSEGLPSFRSMHNLRQDINDAAASRLESERNIAEKLKTQLDSVFTNLEKGTPEQIAQAVHAPPGIDAGEMGKRFKAGLTAYGAAKRVQEIQRIFDKADVHGFVWSQSGLANAIKTKFRQIYVNDRSLRKFSPDEQKLIRDIAKGNLTDFLLTLGSKAAVRGPVTAGVNSLIGHGPIGGLIISGAGELAKGALDRRQVAKVQRLQHHIMNKGESALRDAVGETVYDHLNATPNGAAAIKKWVQTKGANVATRSLAMVIAQATKRPDLLPQINDELSRINH